MKRNNAYLIAASALILMVISDRSKFNILYDGTAILTAIILIISYFTKKQR